MHGKKSAKLRITLIGAGNLAGALASSLHQAGFVIEQIVSRATGASLQRAKRLAVEVNASATLLGRDLSTPFSVEMVPFGALEEWDLETARKQALVQRPELRGARLQTKIAELDVRREHAKYIPDLSLQVGYLGFQNVTFLPQNAGTVGFLFQWQPFDWGYKKHRIAELNAMTEQKATAERDVEQRVLLEVEEKFRKLGEARILLDALTDQREAEQAKLGEVKNRYNQKAALLSDLMQQQAAVSQAEAQYQQALAGFWTARANFEKAIGVE